MPQLARVQAARYNPAPQQPRGLSRRVVDSLHKNGWSQATGAAASKHARTKPVDPTPLPTKDASSDIDREPDSSSSDEDGAASGTNAATTSAANDARQVRQFREQLAQQREQASSESEGDGVGGSIMAATSSSSARRNGHIPRLNESKKRKSDDETDERILGWSQDASQSRLGKRRRYGDSQAAVAKAGMTKKAETKTSGFTNIHVTGEVKPVEPKGGKRRLAVPAAGETNSKVRKAKSGSKFKLPKGLPSPGSSSPAYAVDDLENEDPGPSKAQTLRRKMNVPETISVGKGGQLDSDRPLRPMIRKTMKLPQASTTPTSNPSPTVVNEVLEDIARTRRARDGSVASSDSSMSDVVDLENPDPDTIVEKVQCPICSARLLKSVWDEWSRHHPRMTLRDKQQFCNQHTVLNARELWSIRHYPQLQWGAAFRQRLQGYKAVLDDLMAHPEQSFFRAQLQGAVDRGESRTVQKRGAEVHRSTVGYYGLIGLEQIASFISYEYAADLRALARTDAVIAARDQSGYINMVLVPEVVSRLIMDDMNVDLERAREIMDESHELGELLCGSDVGALKA